MKKNRKSLRNFLSALLVFVLCFSAAMTAFAEGGQSETEPEAEQSVIVSAETEESSDITSTEPGIAAQSDTEDSLTLEPGSEKESVVNGDTEEIGSGEEQLSEGISSEASEEESSEEQSEEGSEEQSEENTGNSSSEEPVAEEPASEEYTGADLDEAIEEIVESIREEYGDEAAASFEKMMKNSNMRAFIEALQKKLEEEFPGMSDEEISQSLENMSDEETFELMEKILNDPEILKLSEAVSEDEELAGEMGTLLEILFGDDIDIDMDELPELEEPVSGTQGDGISWNLDTNGTLTISGSGSIVPAYEEFAGMNLPFYEWDDYIDNITKIIIKDGVTDIPENAFSYSSTLKTVVIPASVKTIGSEAFIYCENLTAVYFQGDAPDIAKDAFDECSEELTLYYREGTKGWDKVTGCKLAVWTAASSEESSEENRQDQPEKPEKTEQSASSAQETTKTAVGSGTPDTGDSGNAWPFILLMAAAVICGGVVIIRMRKKR